MNTIIIIFNLLLTFQACHPKTTNPTINMVHQNLIQEVKNNDVSEVKKALENGADVNQVDAENRSLLLIATMQQNYNMAVLLLKHGADVNQQAANKDSAFLYAGATGQTNLLKHFLVNGARFDVFNRYNGTALIPACERGHIETVKLLANTKDFPINHVNRLGWTALMEAIVLGDGSPKYQQIVQILKDAGADMHIPDYEGITPLQHAQKRGLKEIVQIIKPN